LINSNFVVMGGRITREVELKYFASGTPYVSFSIANNRPYKDRNDEWKESTSFVDCIAEKVRKGDPIIVLGLLEQESWEKDGQKRSKLVLKVDRVNRLDVPSRGDSQSDGGGQSQNTTRPQAGANDPDPEIPF